MSYLDSPRITFSGRFLSDVPTRNNDAQAYRANPPDPLSDAAVWNMGGGGTFDLLGCHVDGAELGADAPPSAGDSTVGAMVMGGAGRASAKLVDLDTGWQFSSQLWGLTIRLVTVEGVELLAGSFRPAAFRDLWARPGAGRAASFTSVLEDVVFTAASRAHQVLDALRVASSTSELSIVLNTFAFGGVAGSRPMSGAITGCIGGRGVGEPRAFVAGRRFEMGMAPMGGQSVPTGRAVAVVTADPARLVIDLGNAYPFVDPTGTPHPVMATWEAAVLPSEGLQVGAVFPASAGDLVVGPVALTPPFPQAAIVALPLTAHAAAAAAGQPLALLQTVAGQRRVIARESREGIYVRADDFVYRMESASSETITFHARQFGAPVEGQAIALDAAGPLAPIAEPVQSGPDGSVNVLVTAVDPGHPRENLDGAIAKVRYAPRRSPDGTLDLTGSGLDAGLDVVVAHVYDPFPDPADLEAAVRDILGQYASIYPVMAHLVDLGELEDVARWRAPMLLSLHRDIGDPNHMPVTRDLSAPKRDALIRWLEQLPPQPRAMARPAPTLSRAGREPDLRVGPLVDDDAKGLAAQEVLDRAMAGLETDVDDEVGDNGAGDGVMGVR